MPVRSLNSSVLRWPHRDEVDIAVRDWARRLTLGNHNVRRVGYTGSYTRETWGVGSDVDIIIVVHENDRPFMERARSFDTTELPVPADVLVYVDEEWKEMAERRRAPHPVVWVDSAPSARNTLRTTGGPGSPAGAALWFDSEAPQKRSPRRDKTLQRRGAPIRSGCGTGPSIHQSTTSIRRVPLPPGSWSWSPVVGTRARSSQIPSPGSGNCVE
jgi:predicted nucleotidyltransferase